MSEETPPGAGERGPRLESEVQIVNKRGLHARASAKFVQCAERFKAQITVEREGNRVSGTSIMGLMMLAAATGTTVTISACGPDAGPALAALAALVANRFGEDD